MKEITADLIESTLTEIALYGSDRDDPEPQKARSAGKRGVGFEGVYAKLIFR